MENIQDISIIELIPQRPPFVMVDKLVEVTENSATSETKITDANIFCSEGIFQEEGMIENIAQTAAAMSGYAARTSGNAVKLGFIGALKRVVVNELPKEGDTLRTSVEIQNKVMNVEIIQGKVMKGDQVLAETEMKIFLEE